MATKATAFRADRPSLPLHKYTKEDPNQKVQEGREDGTGNSKVAYSQ